ncbi:hypothetical protein RIF29_18697 [Crotalaria pallida]|uniref:Core domain-containing protein n=1 Tax=Crotalaria pallida TaxID=3830 RepID=A0AAN9F6E4_CROPI
MDEKGKFDELIEDKGVKILIDPKALMHVIGTEMDFVDDKLRSEFIFVNPNSKGQCGCGESFMTTTSRAGHATNEGTSLSLSMLHASLCHRDIVYNCIISKPRPKAVGGTKRVGLCCGCKGVMDDRIKHCLKHASRVAHEC